MDFGPTQPSAAAILDEKDWLARQAAELRQTPAPPAPNGYLTVAAFEQVLEHLGAKLGEELRNLRIRLAEIEKQERLKYVGAWKHGGDYKPGEVCSYGGGMWVCKQSTGTRPNKCPEAWQLAVKSGAR